MSRRRRRPLQNAVEAPHLVQHGVQAIPVQHQPRMPAEYPWHGTWMILPAHTSRLPPLPQPMLEETRQRKLARVVALFAPVRWPPLLCPADHQRHYLRAAPGARATRRRGAACRRDGWRQAARLAYRCLALLPLGHRAPCRRPCLVGPWILRKHSDADSGAGAASMASMASQASACAAIQIERAEVALLER